MALILLHQNVSDFLARFREDFRGSEREVTLSRARFAIASIQNGTFTDTQMRTAFGLSTTAWNTLKTKMNALITAGNTLLTAAGE